MVKPSDTRWLSHERCVKAICKELLPLLQTLSQYTSHLPMLRQMVYTPFWLVLMVYQVLSALSLLNLFMQKKIADFSKLPFMLKSTHHLKSINESDASWCTAAQITISNLETELGITIKGSRRPTAWKSPPLSVQQFLSTSGYSLH